MILRSYARRISALVGVCLILAASSMSIDGRFESQDPLKASASSSLRSFQDRATTIVADRLSGYFSPSLSAREAEDFLLTPAFIAQECISDGVVITYPSE